MKLTYTGTRAYVYTGGIGLYAHCIRATGSYIRGTNGTSNGIVPMLRVFNDTARYARVLALQCVRLRVCPLLCLQCVHAAHQTRAVCSSTLFLVTFA